MPTMVIAGTQSRNAFVQSGSRSINRSSPMPKSATAANIKVIRTTARFSQVPLPPGAKHDQPRKTRPNRNIAIAARCHFTRCSPWAISPKVNACMTTAIAAIERIGHSKNLKSIQKARPTTIATMSVLKTFNQPSSLTAESMRGGILR